MAAPRKSEDSTEDHWHSSKVKGFNFDDDDDEWESTKQIRSMTFDDWGDDAESVVNWDGSSAGGVVEYNKSARFHPPSDQSNFTSKSSLSSTSSNSGRYGLSVPQTHTRSSSFPLVRSDDTLSPSSSTASGISIDEVVNSAIPKHQPTSKEVAKLESEIQFLRRSLESAKHDKWSAAPVEDTIKRLMTGQVCSLELYKGMEEKTKLLAAAIKCHDGNAITAVILFLKNTLKQSTFNRILIQQPVAADHYIAYLYMHKDYNILMDILGMLRRTEEAAMLKYKQSISIKHPQTKIKELQNCSKNHFAPDLELNHDAGHINEHISLLERQLPVEDADARIEREGKDEMFKKYPRAAGIVNQSVLTTLYYCCFYHFELAENSLASPQAIRHAHRLTDKQFLWVALGALSRLKHWVQLESLFHTKGWFGGTKIKSVIGFDKVVDVLHKTGAPKEILSKYIAHIDNPERRLEVAKKYKVEEAVVHTLIQMKDREQLVAISSKLTKHSRPWLTAEDALRSSTMKWKN